MKSFPRIPGNRDLTDKYNSATNPNATASPCKRVAPRMIDKLSMACPYHLIDHVDTLYGLMLHDKKNERRGVNFTLLPGIGEYSLDNYCSKDLVVEALSQV